jgi:hypothetical protein
MSRRFSEGRFGFMSKRKNAGRRRVFVCSPLAGAIVPNTQLAKELCKAVVDAGHAAFAPHVFYQQIGLDETSQSDRQAGIECGMAWLRVADEIWIFAEERSECSTGMLAELEWAERLTILPVLVWMPEAFKAFKGRGTFKRPTVAPRPPPPPSPLIPASE